MMEKLRPRQVLLKTLQPQRSRGVTYYRLNYVPLKRYVEVLTPGTYKCDLIWKWGLCRGNQVKIKSYWIRVALITLIRLVSLYEEENVDIERYTEDGVIRLQAKGHQGSLV